ncbi:NudC domain-containing protein 3 [Bulinus truncatus]|nr:NudC domain-containing protein 3 [Bulinus truncatus]
MASNSEQYDGALLGILQNEGKVAPFLDVILGFLYRRTDYFRIMRKDTDKLGFPPGVAFKLLENIFRKYENLAASDYKKAEELKSSREKNTKPNQTSDSANKSVEIPCDEKNSQGKEKQKEPVVTACLTEASNDEPVEKRMKEMQMDAQNALAANEPASSHQQSKAQPPKEKGDDDEEVEDPEQARQRRELQANPLTYNGAERDSYYWSQTITEVDLRVKVPKHIEKGKQVKVEIKKKHISVKIQGADNAWNDVVNNELSWEINIEESMWTLNPGEFVHINLEKKQERWWENVFVDEPKINTRKIDCSRPMTDLDDEAQAKIEEMMYNQRQKQLGLPQSHEAKTHDMLRKAWDAEGSPFKGQPFDPSKFNVDPSGVINFND